jgi:hypothetical protein
MNTPNDVTGQGGSLRLDFAYDHNGLRLRKRAQRRKQAPPGTALDREPPGNVIVVELRSADGAARFRRLLADAIPQSAEISDEDGSYHRVAAVRQSGGFSVVVPHLAGPTEVVVSAGPGMELAQPGLAPPPGERRRWRELTRARLDGDSDGG